MKAFTVQKAFESKISKKEKIKWKMWIYLSAKYHNLGRRVTQKQKICNPLDRNMKFAVEHDLHI